MDLLIELIVWIFKSLFGEQEKNAEMPPTQRPKPRGERPRGPYIYGDEGAPKTLEEILQEARRKAQEKAGGGGPRPNPTTQIRPLPPKVTRRIVPDEPVAPVGSPVETESPRPSKALEWSTGRQAEAAKKTERPRKSP